MTREVEVQAQDSRSIRFTSRFHFCSASVPFASKKYVNLNPPRSILEHRILCDFVIVAFVFLVVLVALVFLNVHVDGER